MKGPETTGLIFDIEEFGVLDGPGIRTVVFLKGCPLRCTWCHNPEGLLPRPQRSVSHNLCAQCGACRAACPALGKCIACGACVPVCPQGCIRIAGQRMTAGAVAERVSRHARALLESGGGVTFSGGEALLQTDFVLAVRALLPDLHASLETCGFAPEEDFRRAVDAVDLVLFDIKHADSAAHERWTGAPNERILTNLRHLIRSGKPFWARIPLIPGVNDASENLEATAALLEGAPGLERVELLRYNRAAGAKYAGLGMRYEPGFDEGLEPNADTEPFAKRNMEVRVL